MDRIHLIRNDRLRLYFLGSCKSLYSLKNKIMFLDFPYAHIERLFTGEITGHFPSRYSRMSLDDHNRKLSQRSLVIDHLTLSAEHHVSGHQQQSPMELNQVPRGISTLHFSGCMKRLRSIQETLLKSSPSLLELNIRHYCHCTDTLEHGLIPISVDKLLLHYTHEEMVRPVIPHTVREVTIKGNTYTLEPGVIPEGVVRLSLECPLNLIKVGSIPKSVRHLTINATYTYRYQRHQQPVRIVLEEGVIPNQVVECHLKFDMSHNGSCDNIVVGPRCFPTSIRTLYIESTHAIHYHDFNCIPSFVNRLYLINSSEKRIELPGIPSSVTDLTLLKKFKNIRAISHYLPSIGSINLHSKMIGSTDISRIPSSIKSLTTNYSSSLFKGFSRLSFIHTLSITISDNDVKEPLPSSISKLSITVHRDNVVIKKGMIPSSVKKLHLNLYGLVVMEDYAIPDSVKSLCVQGRLNNIDLSQYHSVVKYKTSSFISRVFNTSAMPPKIKTLTIQRASKETTFEEFNLPSLESVTIIFSQDSNKFIPSRDSLKIPQYIPIIMEDEK
ncbi:hypothetical protein DLAC_01706 [Tieghemostelium lacteum]|uniref:FNIP repeat-containing protein n=1 Tax=Tieghemostelium lacteum TaxID=361077 RepID=A0A152A649_TIELA|nr:hypothetical protein DLAC_01706 [Tieghemostelium lacteum]|eukprot:KYR01702.1 hypothetical protein DLAC_01706 [Tieghemostelium lacteum]